MSYVDMLTREMIIVVFLTAHAASLCNLSWCSVSIGAVVSRNKVTKIVISKIEGIMGRDYKIDVKSVYCKRIWVKGN